MARLLGRCRTTGACLKLRRYQPPPPPPPPPPPDEPPPPPPLENPEDDEDDGCAATIAALMPLTAVVTLLEKLPEEKSWPPYQIGVYEVPTASDTALRASSPSKCCDHGFSIPK